VSPSATDTAASPAAGTPGDPAFPNARAAGRNTAEIVIMQTGRDPETGLTAVNSATVEQRGDGQYARISQDGRGNEAGILQEAGATNSVAIIEQAGIANSFFITQAQAGQYLRVRQNGSGNQLIGSGPGGGGTGNTSTITTGAVPGTPGQFSPGF